MATLEEIFGTTQKPTLEQIFSAPPQGQIPQATPIAPDNSEKTIYDILGDAGRALLSPASTALEAISYLDKPRGAIAGSLKALQDDSDFTDGAAKGWKENTSFKELFPEDFKKEDPYYAATIGGFLTDVALDPMWLLPPAKIAKGVAAGSKAVGLTDGIINPAVSAVKNIELGAKATASLEDIFGVNRLAKTGVIDDFNRGRAIDAVERGDYTDELAGLKKQFGKEADVATDYIEALPRETPNPKTNIPDVNLDKKPYDVAIRKEDGRYTAYTPDGQSYVMGFVNGDEFYILGADTASAVRKQGRFTAEQQALAREIIKDHPEVTKMTSNITGPEAMEARKRFNSTVFKDDPGSGGPLATTDIKEIAGYQKVKPVSLTDNIIKSVEDGTIFKRIKDGEITRTETFETLRNAGKEIPDQLLQTHQRQFNQLSKELEDTAKLFMDAQKNGSPETVKLYSDKIKALTESGRKQFGNNFDAMAQQKAIPDYIYRDQVLSAIPDEPTRKAVQRIGDLVIDKNKQFSDQIYDIGRIGDAEYVEFMGGAHLRRSYEKFETADDFLKSVRKNGTPEEWQKVYSQYQKNKSGIGPSATHKIDQRDFMKRQTLSDETMKKMGIVTDAEYRVMDTFNRASKTLREDEYLTKVNQLFGKSAEEAAVLSRNLPKSREYIPIPDSKSYGALAGKWLPRDVAKQVVNLTGTGAPSSDMAKSWQKMVSWWKVAKLAAPAPIMRNLYSGLPMANVFGKVPMQALPQDMARVLGAFSNGGKNNAFIREFRSSGALEGEWVNSELKNILGGKPTGIKKMAEIGMEAFGTPDKFWRAVTYSYHRRQGKSIEEAGKIARKALLDYSAAPDWINTISKNGIMPFAKFPFMAGKETAKALWENPASVTKYTKLQNQSNTEDREKILPDYLKAKTLLPAGEGTRMVNGKPQKVQQNIDLSYILPFSSDFSLGNPVTDAMLLAKTGRNGIGQQVIKPGMTDKEKTEAWGKYIANAVAPSVISPYNIEKLYNASQGNVDSKGRQYSMTEALLQTVGGIKNVTINTEELFQQGMSKIKSEQRSVQDMMRSIARDKSLTKQQQAEKIKEHNSQLKELGKKASEMQKAYDREKKRGAI